MPRPLTTRIVEELQLRHFRAAVRLGHLIGGTTAETLWLLLRAAVYQELANAGFNQQKMATFLDVTPSTVNMSYLSAFRKANGWTPGPTVAEELLEVLEAQKAATDQAEGLTDFAARTALVERRVAVDGFESAVKLLLHMNLIERRRFRNNPDRLALVKDRGKNANLARKDKLSEMDRLLAYGTDLLHEIDARGESSLEELLQAPRFQEAADNPEQLKQTRLALDLMVTQGALDRAEQEGELRYSVKADAKLIPEDRGTQVRQGLLSVVDAIGNFLVEGQKRPLRWGYGGRVITIHIRDEAAAKRVWAKVNELDQLLAELDTREATAGMMRFQVVFTAAAYPLTRPPPDGSR